MDDNLHSPQRLLIELRMEHAELDDVIDRSNPHAEVALVPSGSVFSPVAHFGTVASADDLALRRLKKRRLLLRDQIARLEMALQPPEPA